MKRKSLVVLALSICFILFSCATALASPTPGSWSLTTPQPLTNGFWEEFYIGGGPGQTGNLFYAFDYNNGQWALQGFALESVSDLGPVAGGDNHDSWKSGVGYNQYNTHYNNGTFTLWNTPSLWGEGVVVTGVDAYNYTRIYADNSILFILTSTFIYDGREYDIEGRFAKSLGVMPVTISPHVYDYSGGGYWHFSATDEFWTAPTGGYTVAGHAGITFYFLNLDISPVSAVPAPIPLILFGSGLIGLAALKKKFGK